MLLDKLPAESVAYVIVSCLGAVAAYILGRSWVKGKALAANAVLEASRSDPRPPQG